MSNSPLISNKRKTQVASDGMPHGSGWNACSLPPRKPLSRLRKKVLPKLHKRLLKRPGTPPPKQFTGRSPKRKATPPTRQPRISPQAQRRTAERTMAGRRLDQANSREKRQPRREPLLLHPTAPGPQWCLRRRSGRQRFRLRRPSLIFELRGIWLVKNPLGFIGELLRQRLIRQLRDFVLLQVRGPLISSIFEEAAQEKVVLERLHVFLKCGRASVDVLIDLFVIDQRSDRSLTLIDFVGDGFEIVSCVVDVLDGALGCVEDLVGLVEQIRDLKRRLALNHVTIAHFRRLLGPERDLKKLISQ